MRGVTTRATGWLTVTVISTRTPHAGSDTVYRDGRVGRYISTRTPHAGSDAGLSASSTVT